MKARRIIVAVICIIISALICWVVWRTFWIGEAEKWESYFTASRAEKLTDFSQEVLAGTDCQVIRAQRFLWRLRFRTEGGNASADWEDRVQSVLVENKLHLLIMNRESRSVTFGYCRARNWFMYCYVPEGGKFTPLGTPHFETQLSPEWHFYVY